MKDDTERENRIDRAKKDLGLLWNELRGEIWHVTTVVGLENILSSGEIKPGCQEDNKFNGYCTSINAISLFDFDTPSEEDALDHFELKWDHFLSSSLGRSSIWIKINLEKLPHYYLIPPTQISSEAIKAVKNAIPRVEAAYKGIIPLSALKCLVMVCVANLKEFKILAMDKNILNKIDEVQREWDQSYQEKYK